MKIDQKYLSERNIRTVIEAVLFGAKTKIKRIELSDKEYAALQKRFMKDNVFFYHPFEGPPKDQFTYPGTDCKIVRK